MRLLSGGTRLLTAVLAVLLCSTALDAQAEKLTPATLPDFLGKLSATINQVDVAFQFLANEKLPLTDESGHPLGRRHVKDRRQAIVDLRQTANRLEKSPQDLVLTMTLSDQTEALADELYDLSQIAYDNDREELGQRFTDLLNTVNSDADLVEGYALDLATDKEQRLRQLEKHQKAPKSRESSRASGS